MTNKFSVTIPERISEDLQAWAASEGRKKASLAAFILELAVRQRFPQRYEDLDLSNTTLVKETKDQ